MADKSFGVKELNLLNASGTPTVTSPNNLNLNANTVAISTSCTIGNNLTVTSTTNSANLNVTGIGTLTRAFATDLSVSGVTTITVPANANPHSSWDVVNNSASAYRFTGPGQDGAEDNPNIYLVRGQRYVFKMNASGHPFQIRVANAGAAYSDGVTNNGSQTGNVVFNVQHDAPAQLFYQCTSHGSMVGNIYIVGGPQVISGVVTATTFVGNLTGNVTGTASANAVLTGSTNNQLVTVTGANAITGESNLTFDGNNLAMSGTGVFTLTRNSRTLTLEGNYGNEGHPAIKTSSGHDLRIMTSGNNERLRITSAGHVGIGTVDPAASNITTALASNTNSLAVGIVTCNQLFVSGIKVTSGGHYADLTAAAADGMNHYFPGSSSTSLISNLSTSSVGNPVVNQTADSYFNNYPYYDFYTGNANENGYRYTQTTAKWADGPFSILFWVKPMASTLESESTFVQLGDHPSGVLRCLYTTSTDASRQLKAITIGDDISANNTAVLSTDWNHWATTYDGSVTRYYLNGSLARSHTHSGTLDVGTNTKYIYLGYGYWNSSASNKASMSHMSDIGIWNTKALSAATISSIYNNKRTVVGY